MDNIEQFSLYTAKIFKELYNSFPIPVGINVHENISECLLFDKDDELQRLKIKKGIAILCAETNQSSAIDNFEEQLSTIQANHSELENEKSSEIKHQTAIFNNTLKFLISEGLVRTPECGGYILTAKAFSHLNKTFDNGSLNNEEASYIKTIKNIFSRTAGVTEKIGIGVSTKVISQLLGIS